MSSTHPIEVLRSLAARGRSGELICASSRGEVHVYLQGGRIAWATDSTNAFVFAAHLQKAADIDDETFRHVVEECRRSRLSVGETLVGWGLASWELVRASLGRQIALAIEVLQSADDGSAQVLFLERGYRTYDEQLTFDIVELLSPRSTGRSTPPGRGTRPPPRDRPDLAKALRASVEGLAWVEVFEEERVVDGDPSCPEARLPPELVRATTLDGADFAALRAARLSFVGVALPRKRSVWTLVAADSTFGAAASALSALAAGPGRGAAESIVEANGTGWVIGQTGGTLNVLIEGFLGRAREVLGALVLAGDGGAEPVAGMGCRALDAEDCIALARRRAPVFDVASALTRGGGGGMESMGFYLKTAVSGEPRFWCFGAELASPARTLWLFLDRGQSQGLGWACLTSLARSLAQAPAAATGASR